jgi:hypothetical protein
VLVATDHLVEKLVSTGLPPYQWQLEIERWFQSSLAKMQGFMVQFASKRDVQPPLYVITPDRFSGIHTPPGFSEAMSDICNKQFIQSTGQAQSFSFLGLMIVVVVTVLLLILSFTIESCISRGRKKQDILTTSSRSIAGQADGKLHLLRMAIGDETRSNVSWYLGKCGVPVSKTDVKLNRPTKSLDKLTWYTYEPLDDNNTASAIGSEVLSVYSSNEGIVLQDAAGNHPNAIQAREQSSHSIELVVEDIQSRERVSPADLYSQPEQRASDDLERQDHYTHHGRQSTLVERE